jgi:hypothetical protein
VVFPDQERVPSPEQARPTTAGLHDATPGTGPEFLTVYNNNNDNCCSLLCSGMSEGPPYTPRVTEYSEEDLFLFPAQVRQLEELDSGAGETP